MKTVSIPVNKKAHHPQFPETPFCLTKSVTRLGVSVENVVATILTPKSHHGISLPAKKKDFVSLPALFEAHIPIPRDSIKKMAIIPQSNVVNIIYM